MRIRTLQDLVRQARAKPGTLNYGSSGNGTIHHIAGEVFKADAGIDLMHVPYKGSGQSVPAVISGGNDPWYAYDVTTHVLTPKPRVFVVRTTDGNLVKVAIERYYDGAGGSGHPTLRYERIEE